MYTTHSAHGRSAAAATSSAAAVTSLVLNPTAEPEFPPVVADLPDRLCAGGPGDLAELLRGCQSDHGTPTGVTADVSAAWRTETGVQLWVTGDCLALTADDNGEVTVHGCEESPYGVDAELIFSQMIDQGIDVSGATAGASSVYQRDIATTNTPVGRTRFTDYTPPEQMAAGGSWIHLPATVKHATLLTAGAVRMLSAAGLRTPEDIDTDLRPAEAAVTEFAGKWEWLQSVQSADPERSELPRLRDIDEAAVAVLDAR